MKKPTTNNQLRRTKYTHTFTTNTLASKTFGTANDDFFTIFFTYVWNTTFDERVGATTAESFVGAGTIDIAQVQLCAGDVALPFMPKSFGEELRACQRYYEKGRTRLYSTNTYVGGTIWFKANKRTASYTATYSDAVGTVNRISTATGGGSNNITVTSGAIFANKYEYGFESDAVVGASANNWVVFNWTAEAEL